MNRGPIPKPLIIINGRHQALKMKCVCVEFEEMSHLYECKILISNKILKIEYEEIYKNNPIKHTEGKRKIPCDLLLDPLNFKRFSIG